MSSSSRGLARAWCARHGRDWRLCARGERGAMAVRRRTPARRLSAVAGLHRRLLNGEERIGEREKEVRSVILPRVRLSRGGALSGGGGPRSGTVERPHRGESEVQAARRCGNSGERGRGREGMSGGCAGTKEVRRGGMDVCRDFKRGLWRDVGAGVLSCMCAGRGRRLRAHGRSH